MVVYKNIYFLGIGGIGMSAIARWYQANGYTVGGYDKTATPLTRTLSESGMEIHYDDMVGRIPTAYYDKENTLIVRTPAVPADNIELQYFISSGYQIMKRAEILGFLTQHMQMIAVAGTHGKTTTSTLVTHLLKHSGMQVTAFLGGIATNYNTNLLIGGPDGVCVVEADEYDRSFHALHPMQAIVTAMDPDHLDIYGTEAAFIEAFEIFVSQIQEGGTLVSHHKVALHTAKNNIKYGISTGDVSAENIRIEAGAFVFDYVSEAITIAGLQMRVPGFHNIENATAAITIALLKGLSEAQIRAGITSFEGVKRRFEYIYKSEKYIQLDDYAHHPTELEALLRSAKALFADRKVTCVFQPHLYSRTRDFAAGFIESLAMCDALILLDIYPAREQPIEGVSSAMLFDAIALEDKYLCSKADLMGLLATRSLDVIITAGAGDIDLYIPEITAMLKALDQK